MCWIELWLPLTDFAVVYFFYYGYWLELPLAYWYHYKREVTRGEKRRNEGKGREAKHKRRLALSEWLYCSIKFEKNNSRKREPDRQLDCIKQNKEVDNDHFYIFDIIPLVDSNLKREKSVFFFKAYVFLFSRMRCVTRSICSLVVILRWIQCAFFLSSSFAQTYLFSMDAALSIVIVYLTGPD